MQGRLLWCEAKSTENLFTNFVQKKENEQSKHSQTNSLRPYLPNVGSEVGEEVSKGAVVGANDELYENTSCYAAQTSELENFFSLLI